MAGLRVYRVLSRIFPSSFRAKLIAVVAVCVTAPLLVFVAWLLANNGAPAAHLATGALLTLGITLVGVFTSLFLLYHLLTPLRVMADVVVAYRREHRLPNLPEDGRDEVGLLMRCINAGLREIDVGMRELQRAALEDPLTGALNRRGSEQALEASVQRALQGRPLQLYVVDVDNLKPVNDTHGHCAGDRMLVDLVRGAAAWLREDDWIGRWGGDEFLVCVMDTPRAAHRRIRGWLHELVQVRPGRIPVRASVGCAGYRPGLDPSRLYREADTAMYAAKAMGGGALVSREGREVVASPF